jgi:predicted esterase
MPTPKQKIEILTLVVVLAAIYFPIVIHITRAKETQPTCRLQNENFTPSETCVTSKKKSPSFEVYIPQNLDYTKKHPWVLALSPGGNGREMFPVWKEACDKYQWILIGSNDSSNNQSFDYSWYFINETIKLAKEQYPVDPERMYVAGMSGGGMMAHYVSHKAPNLVRGIIVNTCMSHVNSQFENRGYFKEPYPENKYAVFLASPTDFRYDEMKEDKSFLEKLGWKTKWIEFEGGHAYAPAQCYLEAVEWLREN